MARWRRSDPSPLEATLALAVVGVLGSFLASFSVFWLLDVVSPTEQHPAVVASQTAEEHEYRRRRGGRYTSIEYDNVARDLNGEMIAFASNSLLGDEVQRHSGVGDPVVLAVSRVTGRVTIAEFVDERIDLRFHPIMLVAVGFSTTMGIAAGFGAIGLWRRSPARPRTPVLIVATTVGVAVGLWGFVIRENAVEADAADAMELPTDVVEFGSTAELSDWTITLMSPLDAPADPVTDGILERFDLVAVDLEVTYRGTATQVVTGSRGDGLFIDLVDVDGELAMRVDWYLCDESREHGLSFVEFGETARGIECFVVPHGFEPAFVVPNTDDTAALRIDRR